MTIPVWIPNFEPVTDEEEPELLIGEDKEKWDFWRDKVALI